MKALIRLTLVLGLVIGVGGLVVGTLEPTDAARPSDSPYLSALSDFAVGSAEAVPCNTHCYKVQGLWYCQNDPEPTGMFCHYALDHKSCFNDICP